MTLDPDPSRRRPPGPDLDAVPDRTAHRRLRAVARRLFLAAVRRLPVTVVIRPSARDRDGTRTTAAAAR